MLKIDLSDYTRKSQLNEIREPNHNLKIGDVIYDLIGDSWIVSGFSSLSGFNPYQINRIVLLESLTSTRKEWCVESEMLRISVWTWFGWDIDGTYFWLNGF